MSLKARDKKRNPIGRWFDDLMGASALGIRNVLALGGDPIKKGNQPDAKAVFDVNTKTVLNIINDMNTKGQTMGGGELATRADFFHGNQLMAMMYVGGIWWFWQIMRIFGRFVARNFRARIPNLPCTVVHGNSICAREPPYVDHWAVLLLKHSQNDKTLSANARYGIN